jgi:hypothetical protein
MPLQDSGMEVSFWNVLKILFNMVFIYCIDV